MNIIEDLKIKIDNAGKLEKINLYSKMISHQISNNDKDAFDSSYKAVSIFKDYLNFDSSPPSKISDSILDIFNQAFNACRKMGSKAIFHSLYEEYQSLEKHFTNSEQLAILYSHLNYLFWLDNNMQKSIDYGEKSIQLLENTNNDTIIPGRYSNLGYIYECMSEFDKALKYYDMGVQFGLRVNSDYVLCLSYSGFGRINLHTGNYSLAASYFSEALDFYTKKDDDYISVVNNLGIALGKMGKNEEAIHQFSKFLDEETKADYPEAYFDILMNCANSHLALKNYGIAESQLGEALNFARSAKRNDLVMGILINLGNLEKSRENWMKALDFFNQSLEYNKEIKDKYHELIAKLGTGIIYSEIGKPGKSKDYLKAALQLANQTHQTAELITIHENLYEIYEDEKNYKRSLNHLKKLKDLYILENTKKFEADISKLKLNYKKKEQVFKQNPCNSAYQLISRELAAKVKSPMIGASSQMQKIVEHAMIAAENPNVNVLISGESGTGKEIIAKIIHYASIRKNKPFIIVNTSAFTESLIESAFFGNEKGAFTGAEYLKKGYFEETDGGSLFLDEIGDMPLLMQVKFLRVIEHKVMQRVGSVKNVDLNFRLISATNKDLHELTQSNNFRFDLLNRINTIEIKIPPLRQRREDIPVLVHFFFDFFSHQLSIERPVMAKKALELLISYDYPGNVREMKNIIQRTLMFSNQKLITEEDILFSINKINIDDQNNQSISLNLKKNEELLIHKAMEQSGQVQLKAAKLLGISPYSLNRKLKKLNEGLKK